MADDQKEEPKRNGKDSDEQDQKDKPWPDDSVPRPPHMPPPERRAPGRDA